MQMSFHKYLSRSFIQLIKLLELCRKKVDLRFFGINLNEIYV